MPFQFNRPPHIFYEDTLEDVMYIGGGFTMVDTIANPLQFIRWDGGKYDIFAAPSFQLPFPQRAFQRYGDRLYMGGFRGLAYWDGQAWSMVNKEPAVFHMSIWNNKLLVGGRFEDLANLGIGEVGVWDGQSWEELFGIDTVLSPRRFSPSISAIVEYKGELYVGGNFDDARPAYEKYKEIIRWDGSRWKDVGGGVFVGGNAGVTDMVVYKGELYVAGDFYKGSRTPGDHLIRWDGHRWRDVGGSIQGWGIHDLFVYHDELWVGGSFYGAGGVPADNLAKWDGERWCSFGSQFNNQIITLETFRDTLYIGGGFWSIDGDSSINRMAKWIGGAFTDTCGPRVTTAVEMVMSDIELEVWPNPARDVLNVQFPHKIHAAVQIKILDQVGRVVQHETKQVKTDRLQIEIPELDSGIYYLKITTPDGQSYTQKWLKAE